MKDLQEQFYCLALQRGIKILSKKRLTSRDFRRLRTLSKIIFDVNAFYNQVLIDRLAKSRSCERAHWDQPSQQKSAKS